MKKKILAMLVVGIFLMTCISASSALGKEANVTKQNKFEQTITIEVEESDGDNVEALPTVGKEVSCGKAVIVGTGNLFSSVNIEPKLTQKLKVSGETEVVFFVDYVITTTGEVDLAEVFFTLTVHDIDITANISSKGKIYNNKVGRIIITKTVKAGDLITFTITAIYVSPSHPRPIIDIGGGTIVVVKDDSFNRNFASFYLSLFERPILQRFTQITKNLVRPLKISSNIC